MIPSLRHRFDPVMVEICDPADGVRAPCPAIRLEEIHVHRCRRFQLGPGERRGGMAGATRTERRLCNLGVNF